MLQEGDRAPDFCLPNEEGQEVCLENFKGRWVVLYFYPKDMTPGCTQEAVDFRDRVEDFSALGAVVIGISADPPQRHRTFKHKYALPFYLLSDVDKTVLQAYGVWQEKKRFGKQFWGIDRSTFIVDPQGRIAKIYRNVKVRGHVDRVLKDLQALVGGDR